MSVTIKLCLEDEVRRVPIGEDKRLVDFPEFLKAISATFPRTEGSALNLTWKDEDGDTITMSTENEFQEAMRCMNKGVPKFYIEATERETRPSMGTGPTQQPPSSDPPTATSTAPNTTVHVNVECDACGMFPIVGVRYKSAFRADYDLCEGCEKKLAPQEPMIKLTKSVEDTPITPNLANILHGTLGHAANALDCLLNHEETKRVWKECNEKAVSPLVSAVDSLMSRWTRGASVPTPNETSARSDATPSSSASGSGSSTASTTPSTKPALKFIRDVSLPDGTEVPPGATLRKEWLVCNDGTSAWPAGSTLCTAGGDMLLGMVDTTTVGSNTGTSEIPAGAPIDPPVLAGEERVLSVSLTAPQQPGRYVAYFRMKTAEGRRFGHRLWTDIVVTAPSQPENVSIPSTQASEPEPEDCDVVNALVAHINNMTNNSSSSDSSSSASDDALPPIDTTAVSASSPVLAPSPNIPSSSPSTSHSTVTPVPSSPHYAEYAAAPPLYWQQELSLLGEMGFTEIDTLVPLLEKFVKTPANAGNTSATNDTAAAESVSGGCTNESGAEDSGNRDNNAHKSSTISADKLRVAQGLQQVLAILLNTRVTEVYE